MTYDPSRYWSNLIDDGTGVLSPPGRRFESDLAPPTYFIYPDVQLQPPLVIVRNFILFLGFLILPGFLCWWFGW